LCDTSAFSKVINSHSIVAAAHCFYDEDKRSFKSLQELVVLHGNFDVNNVQTDQTLKPIELIIHEKWNANYWYLKPDIAVLVVQEVGHVGVIQPICLLHSLPVDKAVNEVVFEWNPVNTTRSLVKFAFECKYKLENSFCREFQHSLEFTDQNSAVFWKVEGRFYLRGFFLTNLWSARGRVSIFADATKYLDFVENAFECGVDNYVSRYLGSSIENTSNFPIERQFPWNVAVMKHINDTLKLACTGSLVSSQHVLVKATCVSRYDQTVDQFETMDASALRILLGGNQIVPKDFLENSLKRVKKIEIHPQAQLARPKHLNVAVISLTEDIKFSSTISPVCLRGTLNHDVDKALLVQFKVLISENEFYGSKIHAEVSRKNCNQSTLSYDQHLYYSKDSKWYFGSFQNSKKSVEFDGIQDYFLWIQNQVKLRTSH
jgi:hypothetical protein